tara:strand:+ start:4581 stop:5261 length:681 start_codon:yes stop_codon:yes gene_type:complete
MATYLSKNDLEYTVDFGTDDDVLELSALFDFASEGSVKYFYDDLYTLDGTYPFPSTGIVEFSKYMSTVETQRIGDSLVDFDNDYYYKSTNSVVAKHNNKVIGAAICLPHNNVSLSPALQNFNDEKKAHLQVYIDNKVADAWYIENFAVYSPFQLQGVGSTILQKVKEHAESQSYDEVSTFVYDKNTDSKAFLESKGFSSDRTIDVSSHPFCQGISVSNIYRMRCSL